MNSPATSCFILKLRACAQRHPAGTYRSTRGRRERKRIKHFDTTILKSIQMRLDALFRSRIISAVIQKFHHTISYLNYYY